MPRLAKDLAKQKLPGLGLSTLKNCRLFYQTYPQISQSPIGFSFIEAKSQSVIGFLTGPEISAPPVRKSKKSQSLTGELVAKPISATASRKSVGALPSPLTPQQVLEFSWTHLLELLRLDDPWKRAFYENECLLGVWSVSQLQRQIGCLLYERTGLSKNKRVAADRARLERR